MKRFVTYLFTYENGRKGKNIGFVRTDIRGEALSVEAHVRGLGRYFGSGQVYLLLCRDKTAANESEDDEKLIGVPLGTFTLQQGRGSGRAAWNKKGKMDQVSDDLTPIGIALRAGDDFYAASCWSDDAPKSLSTGNFMVGTQNPGRSADAQTEKIVKTPEQSASAVFSSEAVSDDAKAAFAREENPREEADDNSCRAAETGAEEKPVIRRIDIRDIRTLPKKNRYLCNNSFLLHGYFNYHYLVLLERYENGEKKTYLGVPGIDEKPERLMAMLFGFPEYYKEETAGYWLVELEPQRDCE